MDARSQLNVALNGRYTVEGEIGRGGMATVYLAHDIRHDRRVALKVLNPELGAVLGVERFLAEIRVTANLQHPNLLALFDSGEAKGEPYEPPLLYYVMPYIDGESLRARLDREKQLGVDEALRLATAVASALDYAHRHGVIHRDLKPENILLHEGQPLVADFGIALAVTNAGGGRITQTGLSLGTPHYMSPEQATGDRAVDGRTDIYSLGAVLYEMLAGEPPHTGATAQAIIARVLTDRPRRLRSTRAAVPEHVEAAIERALEKLPADRWNTAHEFAESLAGRGVVIPSTGGRPETVAAASPATRLWRMRSALPFLVLAGVAPAAAVWLGRRPEPPAPVIRYALALPAAQEPLQLRPAMATPDGGLIGYVGTDPRRGAGNYVWTKRRDRDFATPVAGTAGVRDFTFSPDGRWIAFSHNATNRLMKVPVEGGTAVMLADSLAPARPGLAWLDDGTIAYVLTGGREIRRVPATGGRATVAWRSNAIFAHLPTPLPGSRGLLFIGCTNAGCEARDLNVVDLATGTSRVLQAGAVLAQYVETGHILVVRPDGGVVALPFDPRRLQTAGDAVAVLDSVAMVDRGRTQTLAVSRSGTLVMWRGANVEWRRHRLVWLDRAGHETPVDSSWEFRLGATVAGSAGWALSPDARRVAITLDDDAGTQVWVKHLPDGPVSRLTFDTVASSLRPRWTADGQYVSYSADGRLHRIRADGTGRPEALAATGSDSWEAVWSKDGQWLLTRSRVSDEGTARDIMATRLGVDRAPRPLIASRFNESAIALSPDGRWIAYESDETGLTEVYVRPFPNVEGGKWQVSRNSGRSPVWNPDGHELLFIDSTRMVLAMPISRDAAHPLGTAKPLFRLPEDVYGSYADRYTTFDISPDGRRLLVARASGPASTVPQARLIVAENWLSELRRVLARR